MEIDLSKLKNKKTSKNISESNQISQNTTGTVGNPFKHTEFSNTLMLYEKGQISNAGLTDIALDKKIVPHPDTTKTPPQI